MLFDKIGTPERLDSISALYMDNGCMSHLYISFDLFSKVSFDI